MTLSSQTNKGTSILQHHEEDVDKNVKSTQSLELEENVVSGCYLPPSTGGEMKGDGSPLYLPNKFQDSPHSSSVHLLVCTIISN